MSNVLAGLPSRKAFRDVDHARLCFVRGCCQGRRDQKAVDMFHPARAVEVELQPLWRDIREAAHGSASGLRNQVFREYEAEVDR